MKRATGAGQIRIIAGQWRSRRLQVPDVPGLRPTPDRVRETLFNWLGPGIEGKRLLDPFAGSGALAFEALSRGAAWATLVDTSTQVTRHLRDTAQRLSCQNITILEQDALSYLNAVPTSRYDGIFLDPPFHQNLLESLCQLLESGHWLAERAWIYTESETPPSTLQLPANWYLHREKRAGQVHYALWQRGS